MYPANYQALFKLWHDRQLTVRVAYHLCAPKPARNSRTCKTHPAAAAEFWRRHAAFQRAGRDPDLGRLDRRRHHRGRQGQAARPAEWAASKRYTIQLHWNPDRTVNNLLDVVEEISKEHPVRDLRWTVLHLYNASEDNLARIRKLGLIWAPGRPLFRGRAVAAGGRRGSGAEHCRASPRRCAWASW